jgi:hypothetical protein
MILMADISTLAQNVSPLERFLYQSVYDLLEDIELGVMELTASGLRDADCRSWNLCYRDSVMYWFRSIKR